MLEERRGQGRRAARSLLVLGGTGDLTARFLLPGLAELQDAGKLPDDVVLLAVGRQDWSDDEYRAWAAARLAEHAGDVPEASRAALAGRLGYDRGDVTDARDLKRALDRAGGVPVVYLALPNTVFLPTLQALTEVGVPEGSTIAVEKPFGTDGENARQLNEVLHQVVAEERVFRIDHFLATRTVLALLGLRFANRLFEPVWNAAHIERVDITFDETLGLEGRAGYYDTAGALRDMLQNHLLQQLGGDRDGAAGDPGRRRSLRPQGRRRCAPSIPRPTRLGTPSAAGTPPAGSAIASCPTTPPRRRGRRPADRDLRRVHGHGGHPALGQACPSACAAARRCAADRHEIAVRFRPVPHPVFRPETEPDVLRLSFRPDRIGLELNLNGAGGPFELERRVLDSRLPPPRLSAYGLLLDEMLSGSRTLSISDVEAEESWRIVQPVLAAWAAGAVPLREYPAGSAGPATAAAGAARSRSPARTRAPTSSTRRSARGGPITCSPTGSPSGVKPPGTDSAGQPVAEISVQERIHSR